MRGKQSSKISLKKRLLKRRQALTRRWNKQSTRRHLLVYLLCNLLLVGSLYGCIFAIPNVRDVRTVRTKITDVHYEAVRWAQWIAFTTPDGERFFLRRDWRGYDAAREDTARLQALAAGGTELELTVSTAGFPFWIYTAVNSRSSGYARNRKHFCRCPNGWQMCAAPA